MGFGPGMPLGAGLHEAIVEQARSRVVGVRTWLLALPRSGKRVILAGSDFTLMLFALWLALTLRYNAPFVPDSLAAALVLLAAPVIGVATFSWFGLYRLVTRYIDARGSLKVLTCLLLSVLIWSLAVLMTNALWVPRSVILALYPLAASAFVLASRQLYAALLRSAGKYIPPAGRGPKPMVIYGAGATGVQLMEALQRTGEARPVGFLDETASLWGQYAGGVKIYRPDKLARLIEREGVRDVILALPESQRRERQLVLKKLQDYPVRVKTLPAMEDFAAGRATVSDLRPVDVEDLLGRDPVPPDPLLLARSIRGKSVLVTGAGGSIGSELVRQILRQQPASLILLELSEVALYEIELEVSEAIAALPHDGEAPPPPKVVPILGSVRDAALIRKTILENGVETIYHAAAYKHVPLVEQNPIAGLSNNVLGTQVVAEAARDLAVERFVLISTDKAVRPTNIMGASKRLSELILQAHAADPQCATVFTMVRFGNVLDSSGSVVRRFRKQIQSGGPVTVTDPRVIRYFMSIPEAATLVLQAGAMAAGGEVFVLDMGEPVKIDELARSMVRLMGLEVKDDANPNGDIPIAYIGLRPGEKLYEELLIGTNTRPTEHPLIQRSQEPALASDELDRELGALSTAMSQGGIDAIDAILTRVVEGYLPERIGRAEPTKPISAPSRTLH